LFFCTREAAKRLLAPGSTRVQNRFAPFCKGEWFLEVCWAPRFFCPRETVKLPRFSAAPARKIINRFSAPMGGFPTEKPKSDRFSGFFWGRR
jgi:hypothetical protein